MKLYYLLFETGPSAQSAIPTLGDDPRRVSRTGVAAQDAGFRPEDDWDSTFPQEDGMEHKITP